MLRHLIPALCLLGAGSPLAAESIANTDSESTPAEHAQDQRLETYCGIAVESPSAPLRAQLDLAPGFGLLVVAVEPGSPAAEAGVRIHDVLISLDDQQLVNSDQLQALIGARSAGQSIGLTIRRGGRAQTLSVTLGQRPVESKLPDARLRDFLANRPDLRLFSLDGSTIAAAMDLEGAPEAVAQALTNAQLRSTVAPVDPVGAGPDFGAILADGTIDDAEQAAIQRWIDATAQRAQTTGAITYRMSLIGEPGAQTLTITGSDGTTIYAGPPEGLDLETVPAEVRDLVRSSGVLPGVAPVGDRGSRIVEPAESGF